MEIEHKDPECTGRWLRRDDRGEEGFSYWYCDRCGATYQDCTHTALAAFRENTMDHLIRTLGRNRRR